MRGYIRALAAASLLSIATLGACELTTSTDGFTGGSPATEAGAAERDGAGGTTGASADDGGAGGSMEAGADGGSGSAYRAAVLQDEPIAYWRLGELSGTVCMDQSGNGNDATLDGAYSLGAPGALRGDPDTAIRLTATTGRIHVGNKFDFAGTVPFSFEAWVSIGTSVGGTVFSKMQFDGSIPWIGSTFYISPTRPSITTGWERWDKGALPEWIHSTFAAQAGEFVHYVITFSGSLAILYVNGAVDSSRAQGSPIDPNNIGFDWGGLDGTLDELALYGAVLPSDRVLAHYRAAVGN